jgi:succinate-semialdehyde dehydrogenase/glutarate-semialdehyde dehydrogenase
LMAGNAAVLKHASNVPGCALALEQLFRDAKFPPDLFRTLLVGSGEVAKIIEHKHVRAVTLTGSTPAGRAVAAKAGAMLRKTVLELGGSDAFIVLADADVAAAAETGVRARLINNGQSCIAAKRFIVVDSVRNEFTERFVAAMQRMTVGDPMEPGTDVGPLATRQIRDDLADQLDRTIDGGARVLLRGGPRSGAGWYFDPAVVTDVPGDSPAACDELFGPVAAIFAARDTDDAIRQANASRYGLGASVWTSDRGAADHCARSLDAGTVVVNAMVRSDPRLPFGGVKRSGYGRELGVEGMREFMNVKTVRITGLAV